MLALLSLSVMAVALALRMEPHRLAPAGVGVDHWFWRVYVEEYRRTGRFPPELPRYILDEHQWYPPLFPLLVAQLPGRLFERWSHLVASFIDLVRLALLMAAIRWVGGGDPLTVAVGGLIYATSPIQVSYNVQLNPRALGALFLDTVLLILVEYQKVEWGWPVWAVLLGLGGLILLTHKMTSQLFWFLVIAAGLLYGDWRFLALAPGSVVVALALSRGFYWKVLRAHVDIVKFWNRNWRWIGADQIRESPLYGEDGYERPSKLHQTGLRGVAFHVWLLVGYNPAAWLACFLVYERLFVASPVLIYPTLILVWLLLTCLFALMTTFVPRLKCLGAGHLYVYNTTLAAGLLLALTFRYTRVPVLSTALVVSAVILNAIGVAIYYRHFRQNRRLRIDEDFDQALGFLGSLPEGVVMTIPAQWHEPVAYKTRHRVLWGAHGYGFARLEPVFPRLLRPIGEVLQVYDVRYLLTMDGALPDRFVRELPESTIRRFGDYLVYDFAERPPASRPQAVAR